MADAHGVESSMAAERNNKMNAALAELKSSLPHHQFFVQVRPDGSFFLSICKAGTEVFAKVVERDRLTSDSGIRSLLHDILRGQKLVSGEVSWKGVGAHWISRKLPTFTGIAVNPTAAKQMWTRRADARSRLHPRASSNDAAHRS